MPSSHVPMNSLSPLQRRVALALFMTLASLYVLLTIIGGSKGYSAVPHWDMWNAYLNFFVRAASGDLSVWWEQHNEHRILLSRILFWLDIGLFKGTGLFLLILNYIFFALCIATLLAYLKEIVSPQGQFGRQIIGTVIIVLLSSWIQENNYTWAFQSQFILAQLIPLVAFYLLHRSHVSTDHSARFFTLACLAGVGALGTMANGVLAMPLLTLLGAVVQIGKRRFLILATLAILTTFVYFHNYHAHAGHGSVKFALLQHPGELFQYVLLYLGGPVFYITRRNYQIIAQLAGIFLIGNSVALTWQSLKSPRRSSAQLALLTFLLYVGGTAVGTAGGRLIFGLSSAVDSRYMTPVLMAWSALLILHAPRICRGIGKHPARVLGALLLVPILLLPEQLKSLESRAGMYFERKVAVLALELGIRDPEQIAATFPFVDWALTLAKVPSEQNLSIFADPAIKDVNQLIGQSEPARAALPCTGNLESYERIDSSRYARVRGWLALAESRAVPQVVHLLDDNGQVVGYALTGQPRPDVEAAVGPKTRFAGFKGYVLAERLAAPLVLRGLSPECELRAPPISETPEQPRGERSQNRAQQLPPPR